MEYMVANGIIILIAIIGSILLSRLDEGFWMGVNNFYIIVYLLILGIVSIVVNISLLVMNLVTKGYF